MQQLLENRPVEQVELQDVHRHAAATLFTVALHCTCMQQAITVASSLPIHTTGLFWGLESEQQFVEFVTGKKEASGDVSFYGKDLVAPKGLLQNVYRRMNLPESSFVGLLQSPVYYNGDPWTAEGGKQLLQFLLQYGKLLDQDINFRSIQLPRWLNIESQEQEEKEYRNDGLEDTSKPNRQNMLQQQDPGQLSSYDSSSEITLAKNQAEVQISPEIKSSSYQEKIKYEYEHMSYEELRDEFEKLGDVESEEGLNKKIVEGSIIPDTGFGPKLSYSRQSTDLSNLSIELLIRCMIDIAKEALEEKVKNSKKAKKRDQQVKSKWWQPANAVKQSNWIPRWKAFSKQKDSQQPGEQQLLEHQNPDSQTQVESQEQEERDNNVDQEDGECEQEDFNVDEIEEEYVWSGYDCRGRCAIELMSHWLVVPQGFMIAYEMRAVAPNPDDVDVKVSNFQSKARWLKIGAAAVGGGALLAVTGGLAAPAIAAGLGGAITVMGGTAATATAVSGFIASTGGIALTTTAFGLVGATQGGQIVAKKTSSLEELGFWNLERQLDPNFDFELTPKDESTDYSTKSIDDGWFLNIPSKSETKSKSDEGKSPQEQSEQPKFLAYPCDIEFSQGAMSATIVVSGYVKKRSDFVLPWRSVPSIGQDRYAMIWEFRLLKRLGNAIWEMIASSAGKELAKWFFQTFLFTTLMLALTIPLVASGAIGMMDSLWGLSTTRAQKAGKVLANMLMQGAHGMRPVTLIGYSLGARVIFYCLLELHKHNAQGIVQHVVLLGTPMTLDLSSWKKARSVVGGKFVNGYCGQDWVLGILYRSSAGLIKQVAGLRPVPVEGIDNIDLAKIVTGHTDYSVNMDAILEGINMYNS